VHRVTDAASHTASPVYQRERRSMRWIERHALRGLILTTARGGARASGHVRCPAMKPRSFQLCTLRQPTVSASSR